MKDNPNYKLKVIKGIERDGKLTFEEAYYWYGYGDGSDIHVDASKLDLGKIDIGTHNVGDSWPIHTLSLTGNKKVGLVYGSIIVEYQGNNIFYIEPDTYDFDIHWEFNLHSIVRNWETIGANILHGTGTPFRIVFQGFYHNK
jgi:hypothetical protein